MSKKTKTEKHKRTLKEQARRRRVHVRKNVRRPNPLKIKRENQPKSDVLFADPIFLHHLAGCIFRALELKLPEDFAAITSQPTTDAHFIEDLIKPKEPIQ